MICAACLVREAELQRDLQWPQPPACAQGRLLRATKGPVAQRYAALCAFSVTKILRMGVPPDAVNEFYLTRSTVATGGGKESVAMHRRRAQARGVSPRPLTSGTLIPRGPGRSWRTGSS